MPPTSPSLIVCPLVATIVEIAAERSRVAAGEVVAIVEAMKMEHEIRAPEAGVVARVHASVGALVDAGAPLLAIAADESPPPAVVRGVDERPAEGPGAAFRLLETRLAATRDEPRPEAVARRHALGLRTARENIADLCDPDSFVEFGALAVAAQSRRRDAEDLVRNTPADGIVTGIGTVNGASFTADAGCGTRCVMMAYDATVLAGTQGHRSHQKTDRLLAIAHDERLPVVLFAEGGGGRPGDVDLPVVAGLHVPTFTRYARLSGRVPTIAVVAGRCFAGNAALAGASDVVIAVRGSNLGMGGPAMIEGGGLGVFRPDEIGPVEALAGVGVVDVLADDEAGAVRAAKRYLGFLQGATTGWCAGDQASLRRALPEQRIRAYDVRPVVETICDADSLLELAPSFGPAVLTFLGRIEGRALGLVVSQSSSSGGAIDGDASDKTARFVALCERHGLPIVALIDTPGFMVGPDAEARGQVRRAGRLFVEGARLTVPVVAVVLRKAYGLGAMALAAGGFHTASATIAWPTAEFGAMGLEGAVRLGYRRELEAAPDAAAREALFATLVAEQYARGGAINMAATLEIDAVIDPADTRAWIVRRLGRPAPTLM